MSRPLEGVRVIELAGIGPGPYAGQILADMGADVVVVNRPGFTPPTIDNRGKRSLIVDLRKEGAADVVLDLVRGADVLFEGLRPGVTERLGVGPQDCHAVNPKLVYGRMTGWGQTGPWAKVAGHDLNYISITGALEAMGEAGRPPLPPLNLVGDYGGGSMFLVAGILAGLLKAARTGEGEVVDAAIIDGVSSQMGMFYSLSALGQWQPERQANLLDGGMPFYRCYRTKDDKFVAVGCIEPQFFEEFLRLLEIENFGAQMDRSLHAQQHARLEAVFATRTRAEWADLFDGTDACVSPVLSYLEAPDHPQNLARGGLRKSGSHIHPRPAPGFGADPKAGVEVPTDIPVAGAHTDGILKDIDYDAERIGALRERGVIG